MPNNAHVYFKGTVTQEPKTGTGDNGDSWMKVNVAVRTTKKQKDNPQYYASDYYGVSLNKYLTKSWLDKVKVKSEVLVSGTMCMGEPWQDRNGNWNINPIVYASDFEVVGEKPNFDNSGRANASAQHSNQSAADNSQQATDDEMPF